jgi:hypothetical protein
LHDTALITNGVGEKDEFEHQALYSQVTVQRIIGKVIISEDLALSSKSDSSDLI